MSRRMMTNAAPLILIAVATAVAALLIGGCPGSGGDANNPVFNNTTDLTNGGATYIGSAACGACHTEKPAQVRLHAHTHALTPVLDRVPEFPTEATRAGVPNPPAGFDWGDISYVISGYLHGAFFVNAEGFVLTTGADGVAAQWLLDFPPNGTSAHFAPYLPNQATPLPFDHDTCFRCHTTGAQPQDPDDPRSQEGRPGILGTWAEAGVRCEACHGPGSNHAPNPGARALFVNDTAAACGRCHTAGDDPNIVVARDGFLDPYNQYPQLLASGGHRRFNCTICHDPHASTVYDRANGLRNECTDCHTDQNLAFHDGAVFEFGDHVEPVTCESCHMPLAGLSNSQADPAIVGPDARIGDVRAHIFRINTADPDFTGFVDDSGTAVRKDAQGRAALTVDYVCLRCHNEGGNVFPLTPEGALRIAPRMHANAAAGMDAMP